MKITREEIKEILVKQNGKGPFFELMQRTLETFPSEMEIDKETATNMLNCIEDEKKFAEMEDRIKAAFP